MRIGWIGCLGLAAFAAGIAVQDQPLAANRLGGPIPGLTEVERSRFGQGRAMFAITWDLDPIAMRFNAQTCAECHIQPTLGGTFFNEKLFVAMVPKPGSLSGFEVAHRFETPDGKKIERRQVPPTATFRRTPALFGVGLLDAVPEVDLVRAADPNDKNGDGISGRFVRVDGKVGRLGWKGDVPDLDAFAKKAFRVELGLKAFEPGDDPEVRSLVMNQVTSAANYMRVLAPPPVPTLDERGKLGKQLFLEVGCGSCHTPSMKTGGDSAFTVLRNRRFEAYTDLLLHDIGPGPEKRLTTGPVGNREVRTPPLWGLTKFGPPFFHDASAKTIEEAIRRHQGEAERSRKAFDALTDAQRQSVLVFLEAL
ncbi:MAG TPA: di-heme oxidoredictase family protein [Fimbriimonadaceae bacterium]|nr:di-heme oxidoredictase family protein [Fimbriimonadaceae bacterium]